MAARTPFLRWERRPLFMGHGETRPGTGTQVWLRTRPGSRSRGPFSTLLIPTGFYFNIIESKDARNGFILRLGSLGGGGQMPGGANLNRIAIGYFKTVNAAKAAASYMLKAKALPIATHDELLWNTFCRMHEDCEQVKQLGRACLFNKLRELGMTHSPIYRV